MTGSDQADVVRGDRFSGGPAREFLSSLAADQRIFKADLAVDRAHVIMLAEQGVLSENTAGEILAALNEIETAGYDALPEGEDIHAAIETAVIDRIGQEGGRMHTARSRNDEVATCIRYRLREDLLDLIEVTIELREELLAAAKDHIETIMPGYTHLQPAQPITVGFWYAAYESAFARDTERLLDVYKRVNRCPLGAAAFSGTTFDIDRNRTATLLGFDGNIDNAMDATTARDMLIETIGATTALAVTASSLAEDGIVFTNRGFLELDDDYASTSSIMPQKKNPDTLELVRATTGDVLGAYTGLATILKGLPRAYNRDLQRATGHAWTAVDATIEALEVAGGAFTTAEWNNDRLRAAATEGFGTATGVADTLAQAGVPFRSAHEIVARAGENLDDPTDTEAVLQELDAASRELTDRSITEYASHDQLAAALDPETNIRQRDSAGGAAPSAVKTSLEAAKARLTEHRGQVKSHSDQLLAASQRRQQEVKKYD